MKRNLFQESEAANVQIFAETLRDCAPLYTQDFNFALNDEIVARLSRYYALILKWNARLHLVAPCPPQEFATRHALESLCALKFLPEGARFVDIGSGGGLPAIPCLIARPGLRAALFEANTKKSVFLREALNELTDAPKSYQVVNARFEQTPAPQANVLICRALENFTEMLPRIIKWSKAQSFVLFGGENLRAAIEGLNLNYTATLLPASEQRFLFHITRQESGVRSQESGD